MSKRTIFSRPRTRVYDANYSMGESMYRPALDRLNRKYSGRPLSPPKSQPAVPSDLLERHERAFFDDDLDNCRRRAEKHIQAETAFDLRSHRLDAREMLDEETAARIKSIRANKKVSIIDDVDMESTVNNINARRFLDRTDKILESVGIVKDDESTVQRRALKESGYRRSEDDILKRRSFRLNQEEESVVAGGSATKWTAVKDEEDSAAVFRAKQSRARLNDLDEEMDAIAERQAVREKKAARLRALIAEVAEENDLPPPPTRRALRLKQQEEDF